MLSGGNQQKVVVARAVDGSPRVLIASQPARGLDVEAAKLIYDAIIERCSKGMATLLICSDIEELIAYSDRIAVLYNGSLAGVLSRGEATIAKIGDLMTGGSTVKSK